MSQPKLIIPSAQPVIPPGTVGAGANGEHVAIFLGHTNIGSHTVLLSIEEAQNFVSMISREIDKASAARMSAALNQPIGMENLAIK